MHKRTFDKYVRSTVIDFASVYNVNRDVTTKIVTQSISGQFRMMDRLRNPNRDLESRIILSSFSFENYEKAYRPIFMISANPHSRSFILRQPTLHGFALYEYILVVMVIW